jgi:radical SAM superfamily enzyme YgiQ (UPF0313 family)
MPTATLEYEILPKVTKPARYTGGEMGQIKKDWGKTRFKFGIGYPDLYEVGMSSRGVQIIYFLLNQLSNVLCERFFSAAQDMEAILIEKNLPLFSLESHTPLKDFNFLGFSLQHESVYTNFLNVLKLSHIPLTTAERLKTPGKFPYIFTGGPCVANPLPLEPFVDFVLIGDGEELIPELLNCAEKYSDDPKVFFQKLSEIEGVYVPSLKNPVKKRTLSLENFHKTPNEHIIPLIDTIHYRANIEVMRGCPKFCRFCHASYTNKPERQEKVEKLIPLASETLKKTGYSELALSSLSTGDYEYIVPLAESITQTFKDQHIKVSLPSLRADSITPQLLKAIQSNYRVGLTLAPEAGTQRLRDVIRKDISEEDILSSIQMAVTAGTTRIKLYFMIGLPTETDADIAGIIELSHKIKNLISRNRRISVTFNMSSFVPKPHTPFQWAAQMSMEELDRKQKFLAAHLTDHQFKFRWHDRRMTMFEGFISRGGSEMAPVILKAFEKGCRFDAWQEHFQFDKWMEALSECGINLEDKLKSLDLEDPLPWDHIDMGLGKHFLKQEYQKALA